jgi:hypothetical protein
LIMFFLSSSNKISLSHWKEKPIIPMEEWIRIVMCMIHQQ